MAEEKKNIAAPKKAKLRRRVEKKAENQHMEAPQKLKLLITVVNREKVEFYTDLIQSFEVNMQFSSAASGTATSDILHMMGLEDSKKGVIFSIVREDKAPAILQALETRFATIKRGKGIAYTVPLSGMIGVSTYQFFCNNRTARRGKEEA